MAEYIEREQAKFQIYREFITEKDTSVRAFRALNTVPSADVQPVVRCKDCKHRAAEDGLCKGRGWPMQLVPDDGFCDKGERSEE